MDETGWGVAYDLRKLRAKGLLNKPGQTRRYHVSDHAPRTITGIITLRDHVIAPILAGTRGLQRGHRPTTWNKASDQCVVNPKVWGGNRTWRGAATQAGSSTCYAPPPNKASTPSTTSPP